MPEQEEGWKPQEEGEEGSAQGQVDIEGCGSACRARAPLLTQHRRARDGPLRGCGKEDRGPRRGGPQPRVRGVPHREPVQGQDHRGLHRICGGHLHRRRLWIRVRLRVHRGYPDQVPVVRGEEPRRQDACDRDGPQPCQLPRFLQRDRLQDDGIQDDGRDAHGDLAQVRRVRPDIQEQGDRLQPLGGPADGCKSFQVREEDDTGA